MTSYPSICTALVITVCDSSIPGHYHTDTCYNIYLYRTLISFSLVSRIMMIIRWLIHPDDCIPIRGLVT